VHGVISGDWGPAGRGLPDIEDGLICCGSLLSTQQGGKQMSVLLHDPLGLGSGRNSLGATRPGDRSIARYLVRYAMCWLGTLWWSSSAALYRSTSPQDPEHLHVV
jgi:hypothetical protein